MNSLDSLISIPSDGAIGQSLDAEPLLAALVSQIQTSAPAAYPAWRVVGIRTGGAWLAQRLQVELGLAGEAGVLSHAFHRDDVRARGFKSGGGAGTQLPFDIEGAEILLVDDVLASGRTIRAALNELFDYGRPASVRLAVLVDRGEHELPIRPDFCVGQVRLADDRKLCLQRDAAERLSFEIRERERVSEG